MFCYKLKISEITNAQLPDLSGLSFLRVFIPSTAGNALVLPIPEASRRRQQIYRGLSWSLMAFLTLALLYDIYDVIEGHYRDDILKTAFEKSEPIIALMSFCHSQLALFMAGYSVAFLLVKRTDLHKCCTTIEDLAKELEVKRPTIEKNLSRLRWCFWILITFGIGAIISLVDLDFYSKFTASRPYGFFSIPNGALNLYVRGTVCCCYLIHFTVQSLFAYFCDVLLACSEELRNQSSAFLCELELKPEIEISDIFFRDKLRLWLHENEQLTAGFDQVQETFCWKLLLDIGALSLAMCMMLAVISKWILITGLGEPGEFSIWNLAIFLRYLIYTAVYVLCGWMVLFRPVMLYQMHRRRSGILDKVVCVAQTTAIKKSTRSDILLTAVLMHRLNANQMLFNAGGVVTLGTTVLCTISVTIFGFAWFVLDRSLDFVLR
ncbi:hypothetical protein BV898_05974 [Hypsibius exemplaris]|uniref:Gustatory receptor n=1 Tax=Hypsibius exemplaris TaxID=2072580 RepID=A0A1W0WXN0_HYPEX|nr:hypothetical protein BV898_05974 [Hypsibius exemplaris]